MPFLVGTVEKQKEKAKGTLYKISFSMCEKIS